jgi:hypothetical protein
VREELSLTHEDFETLAIVAEIRTPPFPLLYWDPYLPLHRRFIDCLQEIRRGLAPAAAEQFAEQSREFAMQLERPNVTGRAKTSQRGALKTGQCCDASYTSSG